MEGTKSNQEDRKSSPSSPPNRKKLPPPPKFDPSTLPVFSTTAATSPFNATSSLAFHLPGTQNEVTSSSSSSLKSSSIASLSTSSLMENIPRPPPLPIKKSSTYSFSSQVKLSDSQASEIPVPTAPTKDESTSEYVHETIEKIPPLLSAPPSGTLATCESLSEAGVESTELQQEDQGDQRNSAIINNGDDDGLDARSWLPPRPISPSSHSISPKNSLQSIPSEVETPSLIPIHKTVTKRQKNKNIVHPPYHILTYSQRSIPILILSTPSADAIAAKNHLSLSEMMNGLANSIPSENPSLAGKLPPLRSINRLINLSWDSLRLNFYDSKSSKDTSHQDWERRLQKVVQIWPEDEGKSLSAIEEEIEMHFRSHGQNDRQLESWSPECATSKTTPWLSRFQNGINQLTDRSPFTMIHCPPVVLFVASTSDGIKGLLNLTEKQSLPSEYQNGLFDSSGFKGQYLMLHDEIDGPLDFNEAAVSEDLLKVFGHDSVSLIRINGGNGNINENEDSVWDEFIPPSMPMESDNNVLLHNLRGSHLQDKEILAIRRFISRMVIKDVIPVLERRIHNLNIEVVNNKKGVKNVFKSLWRKPKEGEGLSQSVHGRDQRNKNNIVAYRYDTIESHTRLLADTLFLIRDFDTALSIYRLVKDDYKYDQQLMMSAFVHEMMALCIFFHDVSTGNRNTREILQHYDSALYLYSSAAEEYKISASGTRPSETSFPTRCSTRLCLLLSSSNAFTQEREVETADTLAAASSKETPLAAAVLLEQSASHYYLAGMVRKFAFHMLMAGHMFRSAGQDYHAVRCFASSMYVYHHGNRFWKELFNHLTSALAGQLYLMQRMRLSFLLYTKLLGTSGAGKVSIRSQQKFIDHLVAICRGYEKDSLESVHRIKFADYGKGIMGSMRDVLRSTPSALNFLEIPYMNLPKVLTHTISIQNSSEHSNVSTKDLDLHSFGRSAVGSEEVWQDLICSTEAELDVASSSSHLSLVEWSRLVLEKMDERQKKHLADLRARKRSSDPHPPSIRSKLEPIKVSFRISNPLSVLVPVTSMQLVARLTCSKTHRIYTNEESIELSHGGDTNDILSKKWKFSGSSGIFEIAHFACVSPTTDSESEAWHSGYDENPYFLVTKSRLAMDPDSFADISLEICPLIAGDLEILGMRCKVFNQVWVYNHFVTNGPLLHNTAFNRRNKVRAPANLLRSTIDCTMPHLIFEIVREEGITSDSILLQCQVSKWKIRISNLGAAPATNVTLKTSLPWINILLEEGVIVGEEAATSRCVGPSGTMMRLPLNRFLNSPGKAGVLNPGQNVEIPIEIRTFGSGNQDFYMLFRYELFEKYFSSSINPSPRHRYFRTMVTVPVYPSLTITASIVPSFKKHNEHILSIDVTNFRSDRLENLEITLRKVCIASKNYVIKPLIFEKDSVPEASNASFDYKLEWQERATVHYILSPEATNNHICFLSDADAKDGEHVYVNKTLMDFICLENAHDGFSKALRKHLNERARIESENENQGKQPRSIAQIRRARSSLSSLSEDVSNHIVTDPVFCHPTSRAALCTSEHSHYEINLICSWTAKGSKEDEVIFGQHHLRQLAVKPHHKTRSCPLTITAKFDSDVQHDFKSGPLLLDMEICIQNRLAKLAVDFEFSLNGHVDFDFIGISCFRRSLTGGDSINIPLQVIIFRSGIHNIQSVNVNIYDTDGHDTSYIFPMQWIVRVNYHQ